MSSTTRKQILLIQKRTKSFLLKRKSQLKETLYMIERNFIKCHVARTVFHLPSHFPYLLSPFPFLPKVFFCLPFTWDETLLSVIVLLICIRNFPLGLGILKRCSVLITVCRGIVGVGRTSVFLLLVY